MSGTWPPLLLAAPWPPSTSRGKHRASSLLSLQTEHAPPARAGASLVPRVLRTQRPRRAPITQARPGLDQRADADPSGRENEPQWGQLVDSTKAPRCLIFRSRVHVSEGQDKKGGFMLTQSR